MKYTGVSVSVCLCVFCLLLINGRAKARWLRLSSPHTPEAAPSHIRRLLHLVLNFWIQLV